MIDVHSHVYPEWYLELFERRTEMPRVVGDPEGRRLLLFDLGRGLSVGPVMSPPFTSVEAKLAFMDEHGIETSIVSLGNPWLDAFGPASSEIAREANRRMARYRRETAGRLVGMGILPLAPPDEIAEVVEEVAADEDLRGIISGPRVGGRLLDDPDLTPVWEALADHRVPLLIHPLIAEVPEELGGHHTAVVTGVGFPFVTTTAITRLILGGVLDRHPELRVVVPHGGGALPFLQARVDGALDDEARRTWRDGVRRLLLDAVLLDPGSVRLAAEAVGADRLLFGTDHPYPTDCGRIQAAVRAALSEEQAALVFEGAARRWYDVAAGVGQA